MQINHRELFLAKEILYGSGKHLIWYINPEMRVMFDLFQGGSIGDLRPYLGEISVTTGPDTKNGVIGSYPYLIHSQHRTGYLNHFSDGSRTTAILKHGNIEVDMADVELKVDKVFDEQKGFTTHPVKIQFADGVTATFQTNIYIHQDAKIIIERELISVEGSENK